MKKLKKIMAGICACLMLVSWLVNGLEVKADEKVIMETNAVKDLSAKKIAALNCSKLEMTKGGKKKLKVSNAKGKIKWTSSNKKVATVSKKGNVKAIKAGTAVVKAKISKGKKVLSCKVTVYNKITPSQAKKKIVAMQDKYKEGKQWDNSDYYMWGAINTHCYGCIALVGKISDGVFGKSAPVKRHTSYKKIKTGDHIRIGDYHSVMVIEKKGNVLTVVEGNYNNSIHWGRRIKKSQLKSEGFYVETRY